MKTNLKYTLPMFALVATSALTSCADKDSWIERGEPDPSKELISFTSEGGKAVTRATGFGGSSNTQIVMRIKSEDTQTGGGHVKGADRYTRTVASATATCSSSHNGITLTGTHSDVSFNGDNYRYWDDAYGRYANLSVYAVAVPGYSQDAVLGPTILTDGTTFVNNTKWFTETTENETFSWDVPAVQSAEVVAKKDICFSNNIRQSTTAYPVLDSEKGVYRPSYSSGNVTPWSYTMEKGQMQWNAQASGSTTGKFDMGHLVFYHALSQVTITLIEDDGFNHTDNGANDFKFPQDGSGNDISNIKMLNFPTSGTFDLAQGKWTSTTAGNITYMYKVSRQEVADADVAEKNNTEVTLNALCLPGLKLKDNTDNALEFTIDDNKYYVTYDAIATAVQNYASSSSDNAYKLKYSGFETMKQGEHYQIRIKIKKTGISSLTAQVVEWVDVYANNVDNTNARATLKLETDLGEKITSGISLWRATHTDAAIPSGDNYTAIDWEFGDATGTGYAKSTSATANGTTKVWSTEWFWENNLTSYHFRALAPTDITVDNTTTINSNKVATATMQSGSTLTDYIWGAPFKEQNTSNATDPNCKLIYNKDYGFSAATKTDSQINPAIGPTEENINLTLFHMMAQVNIELVTPTESSDPDYGKRVTLYNTSTSTAATIKLCRFSKNAQLHVGDGLVVPTNTSYNDNDDFKTPTDGTLSANVIEKDYEYAIVPQELKHTFGTAETTDDTTVGLIITTPDNNQYIVKDLSTITVESIGSNTKNNRYNVDDVIDFWYPGYIYHYKIKLLKTGIVNITAQLVDWVTVKGNIGNITLED